MNVLSFQENENVLMDVPEVANLLKLSTGTVYNKVSKGELDHIKIFGKVRFDSRYINGLIEKSRVKSKFTTANEPGNI